MRASRPYMPGYGTLPASEGSGLLPWSWAEARLRAAHDFWLASVRPDGRPHVMPVWGIWDGEALWFSTSNGSRKSRNLLADPRCTMTTADALSPVVMDGRVTLLTDPDSIARAVALMNEKYETNYDVSFQDPDVNRTFRFTPEVAFGLVENDFTGSPTRWSWDR
jgi:PPOX class probable F420-dependent enzyme